MSEKTKVWLAWSSGKDSAWALYALQRDPSVDVRALLTTVNRRAGRVAMHAVREELLRRQAAAAELPLHVVSIPQPCSDEEYRTAMARAIRLAESEGIEAMAFGDLFLEDIRRYREDQLSETGIRPLFPLWQKDTSVLAREMIDAGLEARITCVDPRRLDPSFTGRAYDPDFLADLPGDVDPCGENGEFHSCVLNGPMFRHAVAARPGPTVERDGFVFADLVPE